MPPRETLYGDDYPILSMEWWTYYHESILNQLGYVDYSNIDQSLFTNHELYTMFGWDVMEYEVVLPALIAATPEGSDWGDDLDDLPLLDDFLDRL